MGFESIGLLIEYNPVDQTLSADDESLITHCPYPHIPLTAARTQFGARHFNYPQKP